MAEVDAFDAPGIDFDELHLSRWRPSSPSRLERQPVAHGELLHLLSRFDPIGLDEMDGVALLERTDTKYVMSARQLHSALAGLAEHYRVLEVQGSRMHRYRTLYFDTEDFLLYRHHHAGKRIRCKVRSREYVETNQSFLEVKRRAKRDRTVKERLRTTHFVVHWLPEAAALMSFGVPCRGLALEPKVSNEFHRITLVSKRHRERVTLDLGLEFRGNGRAVALHGVAVAEAKQDGTNRDSDFVRQMRAAGVRPSGFSKYCIGVSMLYQDIKHNQFKPKLRLIGRLMGGDRDA